MRKPRNKRKPKLNSRYLLDRQQRLRSMQSGPGVRAQVLDNQLVDRGEAAPEDSIASGAWVYRTFFQRRRGRGQAGSK